MQYLMSLSGMVITTAALFGSDRYYRKRFEETIENSKRGYVLLILLGGVCGFLFHNYGYGIWKILRSLFLVAGLIACGRIDRRKNIIPNMILLVLLGIRLIILAAECISYPDQMLSLLISAAGGAIYGSVVFLIAKIFSPKSIGLGDVKLFGVIGCYIGSSSIFAAVIMSLLLAMIYGVYMVARKKMTMKDSLSFGPYIAVGTIFVMMIGV